MVVSVCGQNPHPNFPLVNPPASTQLIRNSQTFNTSAMNPPNFHYPSLTPPHFNPSIMNSPILTHPVLHQPIFNPPRVHPRNIGLQHPLVRVVNVGSPEAPMIPHLGPVPRPHQPQSMPHSGLSNQVDAHQAQCLPLLVSTPGHRHQAQPMCPLVSNSIETSAGQSASTATTKAVGIPMTSPRASLPFASPNIGSASKVCTVVTPNVEVVIPAGGNDQSNARRKNTCQNCGRVGHNKRSCKLANPVLTKATLSNEGDRAGPSEDAEVLIMVVQSKQSD
ncbi:hypothetical protein WN943_025668 [Citrus x changshan-huyou]